MAAKNPKTSISFTAFEKQHKVPFVVYVHFESWLKELKTESHLRKYVHEPCAFSYSLNCSFDKTLSKSGLYVGADCVQVFWDKLLELGEFITCHLSRKAEPTPLTPREQTLLGQATDCYICNKEMSTEKFQDFCPLSGRFLGMAHLQCRFVKKYTFKIPVVMQDFSKFGARYLLLPLDDEDLRQMEFLSEPVQSFTRSWQNQPQTLHQKSHYTFSRTLGRIKFKFIDSNRFLDASLEELQEIVADEKKSRLRQHFGRGFKLMRRLFRFPFQHVTGFGELKEVELPGAEGFHDVLKYEDISDEEYERVHRIWAVFKCRTLDDLLALLLYVSVFLLEDIFENLRGLSLDKYSLDPAHYITPASLGWDAMLKKTQVRLEMLTDPDIITFVKSGIRGGVVQCSKRCAIANNQYCYYDPNYPESYIVNFDANNLAGWAMSQPLPFSHFAWVPAQDLEGITRKLSELEGDGEWGYIFEVDLQYPKHLHDLHNDLPFCSQKILVPPFPTKSRQWAKPTLNFYTKKNYIIDYRVLQQCLEHGLVLSKVHRALRFKQRTWLRPYIKYNTILRQKASNEFEVKLYKLLNNAVFGKTIQKSDLGKPICAGFCVLELSKMFMYNFHYNAMRPRFGDRLHLLYMDTDSFFYEILSEDFEEEMSDPNIAQYLDRNNERILGKLKDEYAGRYIREFFGVGAKVYCLDVEGEEVKKAVGVPKDAKQKFMTKMDYERCVLSDKVIKMSTFYTEVKGKMLYTMEVEGTVLSPGDDKRCVLQDKATTLAWGHYRISSKS